MLLLSVYSQYNKSRTLEKFMLSFAAKIFAYVLTFLISQKYCDVFIIIIIPTLQVTQLGLRIYVLS